VGSDEVEFRSLGRRLRLSGDAGLLLQALCVLLDGQHSVEEITRSLGQHSRDEIERILARLAAHGLVLDHRTERQVAITGDPALDEFLRAVVGPDRARAAGARLVGARVFIWGSDPLADAAVRILVESRVEVLTVGAAGAAPVAEDLTRAAEAGLIVGFGAGLQDPEMERLNAASLSLGVPWMPVLRDAADLTIGPLVLPRRSACLACFQTRSEALRPGPPRLLRAGGRPLLPAMVCAAAGTVAVEILKHFLGWAGPSLVNRVVHLRMQSMDWTAGDVLRLPRCRACGIGAGAEVEGHR
jgi:bacteriocin biosynthesis cyclodehydratase domain-containing protein